MDAVDLTLAETQVAAEQKRVPGRLTSLQYYFREYYFWDFWAALMDAGVFSVLSYLEVTHLETPEAHNEVAKWKRRCLGTSPSPTMSYGPSNLSSRRHQPSQSRPSVSSGRLASGSYTRRMPDPYGLECWDWKRRLAKLAAPNNVDAETKRRVAKALASMEAAEARPSEVEEEEKGKGRGGGRQGERGGGKAGEGDKGGGDKDRSDKDGEADEDGGVDDEGGEEDEDVKDE
ncbi:hypothetical protein B0T24DRAFT_596555 [Lasiosphaeria ovina]|uniref:Uncharacterized protein n=1 Tax=Lasiosphaeria ovina TaxID=92902 RepID=A0AAE0JYE7_9PEZI|nr:hypothetical protein B0T24DRAFT_596555 [Lasiosphaeria ovina]